MSKRLTEKHFDASFDEVFARLDADGDGVVDPTELRRLMFGDFLIPGADPKVYGEVLEYDQLHAVVTEYLTDFNSTSKKFMHLVLFLYALEHVCRICRVIKQPFGNALLVGVGGSGKQSLTRLASFVAGATFSQITITKAYSAINLLEDFKPLFIQAGVKGRGAAFLFTDKEIKEESFLEFINIFLNTGELPNLFPRDELDAIIGECREKYQDLYKGSEPTVDELWAFFTTPTHRLPLA